MLDSCASIPPATRMPEALWPTFNPALSDAKSWAMDKAGGQVSPFDVVETGSRRLHAVSSEIFCKDSGQSLHIEPLDAPLVCLRREVAPELFVLPAGPFRRSALQPVQQCLEDGLHHVVWRKYALPFCSPDISSWNLNPAQEPACGA
jgi:hypothetical protein